MVTDEGSEITAPLLLVKVIAVPPAGAAALNVTETVTTPPELTLAGDTVRLLTTGSAAGAVNVAVAVLLTE